MRKMMLVAAFGLLASPAAIGSAQSGPTVGDCVSDGFYGNEPNMADGSMGGPSEQEPGSQAGNVLPSQSPGPFVTDPSTGEVGRGNSIGDYNRQGFNIAQLCREAIDAGVYTEI